jgi:hypothetical protein
MRLPSNRSRFMARKLIDAEGLTLESESLDCLVSEGQKMKRIFGIWQLPNFDQNGVRISGGCLLVDEYFDSEQEATKRAVDLSQGDSDYRSEELDEYDMAEHGVLDSELWHAHETCQCPASNPRNSG